MSGRTAGLLADAVVVVHAAFVLFVIFGGLLTWRWWRVAFLHVPAAIWGAWIELSGGVCPLTPLEVSLRRQAGQRGYTGGFIEHYVERLLYPPGLTPGVQTALGLAVLVGNVAIYATVWRHHHRRRRRA